MLFVRNKVNEFKTIKLYSDQYIIAGFSCIVVSVQSVLQFGFLIFKKTGHLRPLFPYFCLFNRVDNKQINVQNISRPMTGFEPRTSGVGSDCSTN